MLTLRSNAPALLVACEGESPRPCDRRAATQATTAVGNPPTTPLLELRGPAELLAEEPVILCVSGAIAPVTVTPRNGVPYFFASSDVIPVAAGSRVEVGEFVMGQRAYLGVRGGLRTAAAWSPAAPLPDEISLYPAMQLPSPWQPRHRHWPMLWNYPQEVVLELHAREGAELLDTQLLTQLATQRFTLHEVATRTAVLLDGDEVRRPILPSPDLTVYQGTVVIDPDNLPQVIGPDGVLSEGMTVLGYLSARSADHLFQLPAGHRVRMTTVADTVRRSAATQRDD